MLVGVYTDKRWQALPAAQPSHPCGGIACLHLLEFSVLCFRVPAPGHLVSATTFLPPAVLHSAVHGGARQLWLRRSRRLLVSRSGAAACRTGMLLQLPCAGHPQCTACVACCSARSIRLCCVSRAGVDKTAGPGATLLPMAELVSGRWHPCQFMSSDLSGFLRQVGKWFCPLESQDSRDTEFARLSGA
jgi:hypothetical protein